MQAELAELRSVFEDVGCDVTTRSAFTHDRLKTFERVAVDASCDAVLVLNPAPILERRYSSRFEATSMSNTSPNCSRRFSRERTSS